MLPSPRPINPNLLRWERFSPAERTGLFAFAAAFLLGVIDLRLATVPLTLFLALCAMAPFLPRAGFFFPVVSRGKTGRAMIALTFDDGPNPATTPRLLDLLDKHHLPATFFVTGSRATDYPDLVRKIVDHGHTVGNHSYSHSHYRMFWQPSLLAREITATQQALAPLGITPVAFRPPVGITTPVMGKILAGEGLYAVNFSCRAFDLGNRRIHRLANQVLSHVKPDDIVMLHDSDAGNQDRTGQWIFEVEKILKGLSKKGLATVPLSRLIGRPVMLR